MTKIRVLVADDTELAREGLQRLLSSAEDISVVAEADSIYNAVLLARDLRPDIILMDLRWYGDDTAGVSAIEYLRDEVPASKIIAMTVYDDLIHSARKAGAHLALDKQFSREQLHSEIRSLYRADILPPAPTAQVERETPVNNLTIREKAVLELLAEGLTDREIATKLGLAQSTEKHHVASILAKLNARNRTHAVMIALRVGLLEP